MDRPRLLSVSEAATELKASEAYVRHLLLEQRLYGVKVGPVWAIFPDDLEAFKSLRRPPGRPRTREAIAKDQASTARIAGERIRAGTDSLLRKRHRQPGQPRNALVATVKDTIGASAAAAGGKELGASRPDDDALSSREADPGQGRREGAA